MKLIKAEPITLGRVRIIEQNIPPKLEPKSRGIIFDAESVRGILAGTKTMTRRVINPQPKLIKPSNRWYWEKALDVNGSPLVDASREWWEYYGTSPYGGPGSRLYVKESHWRFTGLPLKGQAGVGFTPAPDGDPYQARCYDDHPNLDGLQSGAVVVRVPSLFMPRWASRITLEVLDVRVERLQSITAGDAWSEGVRPVDVPSCAGDGTTDPPDAEDRAIAAFQDRWNAINGRRKGATWADDPWCWCITFRRVP